MSTYYVSSVIGDNSDGLTWAKAKTTLAAGYALATASGDMLFVDSAHSETGGAALAYNNPTAGTWIVVLSVDRNGSTTTGHNGRLAGASVANANSFSISIASSGAQAQYIFGISFLASTGPSSANTVNVGTAGSSAALSIEMESCTLSAQGTGSNAGIYLGGVSSSSCNLSRLTLNNCTFNLPNRTTNSGIYIQNLVGTIVNPLIVVSASVPVALFGGMVGGVGELEVIDGDISSYNRSSGAYVDIATLRGTITFTKLKRSGTPTMVSSGTWASDSSFVMTINVDSSDSKDAFGYWTKFGSILNSATIYADDGFTHDATNESWLIVTTAACNECQPFVTPWMEKWGSSTSAQTQTIEYARDSANTMNDRQIWAEFERVSDAGFPKGTLLSVRNADSFDGTGANWAAGAATWTGLGGSAVKGKLSSGSITPAEKSALRARVFIGVASITDLYIDPKLRIA